MVHLVFHFALFFNWNIADVLYWFWVHNTVIWQLYTMTDIALTDEPVSDTVSTVITIYSK